jgi:hypothetical protein
MGGIESISGAALKSDQKVAERKEAERPERAPENAQPNRAADANSDAVVVSVESRVTDVDEAFKLAGSLRGRIVEEEQTSLEAQPDPEPRVVQDLLA